MADVVVRMNLCVIRDTEKKGEKEYVFGGSRDKDEENVARREQIPTATLAIRSSDQELAKRFVVNKQYPIAIGDAIEPQAKTE